MNKDQQLFAPVYNYLPENAYYNPQNRLGPNDDNVEEYLDYVRAGVKAVNKIKKTKDKFDEDYYYARNEAIEDSREGSKFRFRNVPALSDMKKTTFKDQLLVQNNLPWSKLIFISKQKLKNYQQHDQNSDMDNFHVRNAGKISEGKRGLKQKPRSQFSMDLDEHFNKKKKVRFGNIDKHKADKFAGSKPISIDYYYGINDPGNELNLDALLNNIHNKKDSKTQKDNLIATVKPGFQHRAVEKKAIDLDYYFDRKQFEDADEDFPDFVDESYRDNALFMKTSLRNEDTKSKAEKENEKTEVATKSRKKDLKLYTRVLKDMFEMNSGVLVKYDWLETTVSIRSALAKLASLM